MATQWRIEYRGNQYDVPSQEFVNTIRRELFDFEELGMVPQFLEIHPTILEHMGGDPLLPNKRFDKYPVHPNTATDCFRWVGHVKPVDPYPINAATTEDQS